MALGIHLGKHRSIHLGKHKAIIKGRGVTMSASRGGGTACRMNTVAGGAGRSSAAAHKTERLRPLKFKL